MSRSTANMADQAKNLIDNLLIELEEAEDAIQRLKDMNQDLQDKADDLEQRLTDAEAQAREA